MASSTAAKGGLSTADIEEIRGSLSAGRKPKVVFTDQAGQIAGQTGQVVRLTDPDESDEWLVVRFGRDELPFSPGDLAIPPRGQAGRQSGQAGKQTVQTARQAAQAAKQTSGQTSSQVPKQPAAPAPGKTDPPAPAPEGDATTGAGAPAAAGRPAKRATKAARAGKPKAPPAMTVTLAYESGEWTVAAHQGSKTLAKPYVIRAAEALKMVQMLDVPGVHDAVEQIVNAELTEAQRRAETLRSELAEVEARLAELRDAG